MAEKLTRGIPVFSEEEIELKEGMIIHTTTSDFDYDNIAGCFQNNTSYCGYAVCELVDYDYSEWEPDKCSTGGAYGYSTWKILKVLEQEEFNN